MLDLPDHGYIDVQIAPIDPGGTVDGIMGGSSTTIDRPGYKFSIRYTLPALPSSKEARIFQSLLERGSREDVSYPWPLDIRSGPAGAPLVSAASPAGATLPIKGLLANYQLRQGQPIAVVSGGRGFIHKVTEPVIASGTGTATVGVFPLTRRTFALNDVIEIERPRIRGVLTWEGAQQPSFGARPFSFAITER